MLIMIVAFTGVATEIVVGSALAVMSFSAPRGRISSMEGAPYQGLDSVQATNGNAAKPPTDQWQPRAVIWSIQPNCVSFDAYFYDNDFPNMSDVVWAGSDLTVDLSSPIYFIPQRAFTEANLLPSNFLLLLSLNLWWYGVNFSPHLK